MHAAASEVTPKTRAAELSRAADRAPLFGRATDALAEVLTRRRWYQLSSENACLIGH